MDRTRPRAPVQCDGLFDLPGSVLAVLAPPAHLQPLLSAASVRHRSICGEEILSGLSYFVTRYPGGLHQFDDLL